MNKPVTIAKTNPAALSPLLLEAAPITHTIRPNQIAEGIQTMR